MWAVKLRTPLTFDMFIDPYKLIDTLGDKPLEHYSITSGTPPLDGAGFDT